VEQNNVHDDLMRKEELTRVERRVNAFMEIHRQPGIPESLFAWRCPVPFYTRGSLVRLEHEGGAIHLVENNAGDVTILNGLSCEIHAANESAGLRLTKDNAVAYAIYFCRFLKLGDGCSFPIVTAREGWLLEDSGMPGDLTTTIEADPEWPEHFLLGST
jgi:hypothetical protein